MKDFNKAYSVSLDNQDVSLTHHIVTVTNREKIKAIDLEVEDAYDKFSWLGMLGYGLFFYLVESSDDNNTEYKSELELEEKVNSALNVLRKGITAEYDFSIGINFSDQVYLGAMVSWTDMAYREHSEYTKVFGEKRDRITLEHRYETIGIDCQWMLGKIWIPVDFFV